MDEINNILSFLGDLVFATLNYASNVDEMYSGAVKYVMEQAGHPECIPGASAIILMIVGVLAYRAGLGVGGKFWTVAAMAGIIVFVGVIIYFAFFQSP